MSAVLKLAAAVEALTGVILVANPPIVVSLLFGVGVAGFAEVVGRFAGIALIGLGVSCWPGASGRSTLNGMLVYGTLAALYLAVVGLGGEFGGVLLWPAVAGHTVLVVLLLRTRFGAAPRGADGMDA
ncbi:conserved membrane hypothetical protein [Candidatus Accumulibacter aalborgensis]|uniref:Uncharacterized protein n=1 Tax=Candidatus Accumulibacter aalborgensis TaxID=1860102 RepID=A0A1A8XV52_9PROT|nr:hypothetical protein [Candidatus Accumulibacter aalborgensis]SBT08899.1 conserved membrane hypothetical protein [Candidatus Accumulibacter aalborgensis]